MQDAPDADVTDRDTDSGRLPSRPVSQHVQCLAAGLNGGRLRHRVPPRQARHPLRHHAHGHNGALRRGDAAAILPTHKHCGLSYLHG